jgi:uncharacterized protein involved in type VI secretion and phage assembly
MDHDARVLELLRNRFYGKYRGTVTKNEGGKRGRIEVKVPAVLGDLAVWAMPCVPYAGDGVGLFLLPEPGTGVWVEFEAGDPSFPIWVGCFWADGELPDEDKPTIKVLRTESATLRIDDDGPTVLLSTDDEAEIELTDQIRAEADGGKVEVGGNAVVSTGSSGKVEVGPSSVLVNDGALEVT